MSKIIVTQEQYDAVKYASKYVNKDYLISRHVEHLMNGTEWGEGRFKVFNDFNTPEMARILYEPDSYELEKTIEERIRQVYNIYNNGGVENLFRNGMVAVLKELKYSVEGVYHHEEN